jgi:hypothetical protein
MQCDQTVKVGMRLLFQILLTGDEIVSNHRLVNLEFTLDAPRYALSRLIRINVINASQISQIAFHRLSINVPSLWCKNLVLRKTCMWKSFNRES